MLKTAQSTASRLALFTKELVNNPGQIGAVCPSSRALAKKMASHATVKKDEIVIELGPGTGVVTKALLDQGIKAKQLILIEKSASLTKHLTKRFPEISVINDNALHLSQLTNNKKVGAIVSSLPLRSLPDEVVEALTQEITNTLEIGSKFIQFTYNPTKPSISLSKAFKKIHTSITWKNLPPARLDVFQKQA